MTRRMNFAYCETNGRNIKAMMMLNIVCALATWRGMVVAVCSMSIVYIGSTIRITTVPSTFIMTCAAAACLAERFAPREAMTAVMVVPILSPRIMTIAVCSGMTPCAATAIVRPTVAELDCTISVITSPAMKARNGWLPNAMSRSGRSFKKLSGSCIIFIPINKSRCLSACGAFYGRGYILRRPPARRDRRRS